MMLEKKKEFLKTSRTYFTIENWVKFFKPIQIFELQNEWR